MFHSLLLRWCIRSRYDLAPANVLLHIPGILATHTFPRFMNARWWQEYYKAVHLLTNNRFLVVSEASFANEEDLVIPRRQTKPSNIVPDANRLQRLCLKVYWKRSQRTRKSESWGWKRSDTMRDAVCGYVRRTLSALEIERLRCLEDMKKHDMYSIRWKRIEIPPPTAPHYGCRSCGSQHIMSPCAYHAACRHLEVSDGTLSEGKPVVIRTVEQLEKFPEWLCLLRPGAWQRA